MMRLLNCGAPAINNDLAPHQHCMVDRNLVELLFQSSCGCLGFATFYVVASPHPKSTSPCIAVLFILNGELISSSWSIGSLCLQNIMLVLFVCLNVFYARKICSTSYSSFVPNCNDLVKFEVSICMHQFGMLH